MLHRTPAQIKEAQYAAAHALIGRTYESYIKDQEAKADKVPAGTPVPLPATDSMPA